MAFFVFNRKTVMRKGLNAGLLRVFRTKRQANVFISNDPSSFIVKKARMPKKR
jgi:hypothetical protein